MLAGCQSLQAIDYPLPATELGGHPGLFSGPDGEIPLAREPAAHGEKDTPQTQTHPRR